MRNRVSRQLKYLPHVVSSQDVPGREAALLLRYLHYLRPAVLRPRRDPHPARDGARVTEVEDARQPAAPLSHGRLHV